MSWIQERFEQQRNAPKKQPAPQADVGKEAPSWHDTWYRVRDAIRRDISEFNDQHDTPQFTFSNSPESLIYVRPQAGMVESAVLQISEPRAALLQLDCPIARPGTPRRGEFKMNQGHIVLKGYFTGNPPPSTAPMTPEEFSHFILEPIFFPD